MSATSSPAFQAMELNNNMRCFEIAHNSMWFNFTPMLNNNMRCFEIGEMKQWVLGEIALNNNMRCFEIQ